MRLCEEEIQETREEEYPGGSALADSNMEVQVQAWQAYYGRPDVAITDGEDSLRKQEDAAE
jgi:hypothetical protein